MAILGRIGSIYEAYRIFVYALQMVVKCFGSSFSPNSNTFQKSWKELVNAVAKNQEYGSNSWQF